MITILTPYKEEKAEIQKQVMMRINEKLPEQFNYPTTETADKLQGGENEIIIASLTPANE